MATLVQVVGQEPVPPRWLNAQVPRDLETICLKCLRKKPDQRYASARALAEDLARFQHGEPIQARPVGPVERGVKWVKRNPVVAILLAAVALAMVVGSSICYWFAIAAQRDAQQAREKEKEASEARVEADQRAKAESEAKA